MTRFRQVIQEPDPEKRVYGSIMSRRIAALLQRHEALSALYEESIEPLFELMSRLAVEKEAERRRRAAEETRAEVEARLAAQQEHSREEEAQRAAAAARRQQEQVENERREREYQEKLEAQQRLWALQLKQASDTFLRVNETIVTLGWRKAIRAAFVNLATEVEGQVVDHPNLELRRTLEPTLEILQRIDREPDAPYFRVMRHLNGAFHEIIAAHEACLTILIAAGFQLVDKSKAATLLKDARETYAALWDEDPAKYNTPSTIVELYWILPYTKHIGMAGVPAVEARPELHKLQRVLAEVTEIIAHLKASSTVKPLLLLLSSATI